MKIVARQNGQIVDVTNTHQKTITGKPVALGLQCSGPAGLQLQGASWDIPGERIAAYPDPRPLADGRKFPEVGVVKPLSPDDLKKAGVLFYWVIPQDNVPVKTSCTLSNGQTGNASVTYDVGGPVASAQGTSAPSPGSPVVEVKANIGSPVVFYDSDPEVKAVELALRTPHRYGHGVGIRFSYDSDGTLPGNGNLEWIQTISQGCAFFRT